MNCGWCTHQSDVILVKLESCWLYLYLVLKKLVNKFSLQDMIVIADTKVSRRVGEHFIKHIHKLYEVR